MRRDWTESQIPPPSWNKDFYDCDCDLGTILTAVVRRCYLHHLRYALQQNHSLYSVVESECNVDLERHVLKLERKALRECMVASLYQKAMLNMINGIKQSTCEQKLFTNFHLDEEEPESPHISFRLTQTPETGPFLTPPADYPVVTKAECSPTEKNSSCDREEMLHLGNEEKISTPPGVVNNTEKDIPVSCNSELQPSNCMNESSYDWNQIEKEMARVCGLTFSGSDSDLKKMLMDDSQPVSSLISTSLTQSSPPTTYDWKALRIKHEGELKRKWEFLEQTVSLEKQAKIKRRIVHLFGEDELALADANCDMTEKQASQYREHIAPWIVKHLMPFYKEKRITSRSLFKTLARYITDCLIIKNHTPDECDVWMAVQEFFQHGRGISSEADIFL